VHHTADAYIDFGFAPSAEKIEKLTKLLPRPVMINAVTETLDDIHPDFIRFNGWPGFLKGNYIEAAANKERQLKACALFEDQILFVKDEPGFVSARIVSMIINEAYFTLEAGTSTREEIDTAMKLGTGYPFGPFEWASLIGEKKVADLLRKLSEKNSLYALAEGLRLKASVRV
jgi:3-hydroxybutyryl-CoA dehydrogenase